MAESPEKQISGGYKLKLMRLIYAVVAMVAVIVITVLIAAFSASPVQNTSVGNGWHQVVGLQPFTVGNQLYVTFIGIESCQFCAAERYAIFDALSNFGNWTYYGKMVSLNTLPVENLTTGAESASDAIFYKAGEGDWTLNFLATHLSYTSDYIDFSSAETLNNGGSALQSPSAIQSSYLNKYDPAGSVPFTIIGGNFYEVGAADSLVSTGTPIICFQNVTKCTPSTGYMPDYIISQFNLTGSAINLGMTEEADYISALICFDINNAAPVCSSSAVSSLESNIVKS